MRLIPLLMGSLVLGTALALPQYRTQAIRQFQYKGSTLKKSTMPCTFCHVNDAGGAPWNPFGERLRQGFRENPDKGISEVLFLVLGQDQDSDHDGYSDVLEVFAHTLPGVKDSVPKQKVQDLQAAFLKAGGLEQYQPAKKKQP